MTPLEKAKQRKKQPACGTCPKGERVDGLLYCGVSGKIIMPRFEDVCVCRGKRLSEEE